MANLLYNLAQPFSNTKQYTQGAIVIYNDRMYEMTADEYTPGPFNSEKFTERFLSEMISGKLNSNLSKPLTFTLYSSCGMDYAYANVGSLFMHNNITVNVEDYSKLSVTSGHAISVKKTLLDGTTQTVSVSSGNSISLENVQSIVVIHEGSVCDSNTSRSLSRTTHFTIE